MTFLDRLLGRATSPTRYSDEDLDLVLDGVWQPDHEDTHVGFVQPGENQQVTASTFRAASPLDSPALLEVALDLVRTRQEALRSIEPAIVLSDVVTEPRDGGVEVSFMASHLEKGVQSRVFVCARTTRIVILTFNKYAPLLPEDEFKARSDAIRVGLHVR